MRWKRGPIEFSHSIDIREHLVWRLRWKLCSCVKKKRNSSICERFVKFQLDTRQTYALDTYPVTNEIPKKKEQWHFVSPNCQWSKHGQTIYNLLFVSYKLSFQSENCHVGGIKWRLKFATTQLWCDPFFVRLLLQKMYNGNSHKPN